MRNISSSPVTTSFNHCEPAQASHSAAPAATVAHTPARKAPSPGLEGLPSARRNEQAPHPQQGGAGSLERERRAKAFEAQRHDINTQAGPSNNPHLTALDKLQKRGFKPAVGGLEIPLTPHSPLGGGKRVYQRGETSRDVRVVPRGVAADLQRRISDKREMIQNFIDELEELNEANDPDNAAEIATTRELLAAARVELAELIARGQVLANENRRINDSGPGPSR